MKKPFLLLLLLVSCTNKEAAIPREIPFTEAIADVTTAVPVEPMRQLPDGFYLDSIVYEDTTVNFDSEIYFPQSRSDRKFNQEILAIVRDLEKGEKPTETNRANHTSFALWPTEIQVSTDNITCTFTDQSFTEGAAHYNQGITALRYDLKTHEVLLR